MAGFQVSTEDMDVQSGRDAYSRLKKRIVSGLSIGYDVLPGGAETDNSGVRRLKAIRLHEVSLVAIPMNDAARVTAVKSTIGSLRDFERFLHERGWSKAESKRLAAHGWSGLNLPDEDDSEMLLEFLRAANAR